MIRFRQLLHFHLNRKWTAIYFSDFGFNKSVGLSGKLWLAASIEMEYALKTD